MRVDVTIENYVCVEQEKLLNLNIIIAPGWTKADITTGIEVARAKHWLYHTKKML